MEIACRLVLQTKLKTTGVTETGHGRWQEELYVGVFDMRSTLLIQLHQLLYSLITLIPSFQVDHTHTVTGSFCLRHQTVAGQCRDAFNLIKRQQSSLNLIQHLFASFHCRSRRSIHVYINHTLVFIRNKSGRKH